MPLVKLLFLFLIGSIIGAATIYSIPLKTSVTQASINLGNTHVKVESPKANISDLQPSEKYRRKNNLESELLELKNSFSDVVQRLSKKRKKLGDEKEAPGTEA